jgi:DNA-binding transcriptional MerR regulator
LSSKNRYTYTVSDVAKALGLTPGALHFYEKKDLISVERNVQDHRVYHVENIFRFLSYTKYRSMGFSLKTIVRQFSGSENDRRISLERLRKYRDEAAQKADHYRRLAAAIEQHINSAARIEGLLDSCEFVQSPPVWLFFDEECGWLSKNRRSQAQVQKWIKAMPLVRLAVILHSFEPPRASLGYALNPELDEGLHLPKGLRFLEFPPRFCLHTIIATGAQFTEEPHIVFEKPLNYARSRSFEPAGQPWGHILLVEVAPQAQLKPYLELWIPIVPETPARAGWEAQPTSGKTDT